jgi:hypothetical protein
MNPAHAVAYEDRRGQANIVSIRGLKYRKGVGFRMCDEAYVDQFFAPIDLGEIRGVGRALASAAAFQPGPGKAAARHQSNDHDCMPWPDGRA